MNRIALIVFVILLATSSHSFGQRLVTGRLIDIDTGKPITAAIVTVSSTNMVASPNALGFFQVAADSGDYVVIKSRDYDVMEAVIPNAANFKIGLTKPTDIFSGLTDSEDQRVYLDEFGFSTDRDHAVSFKVIGRHSTRSSFMVKEFYIDGTIKEKAEYADDELYINDGILERYHRNGQKSEQGIYERGKRGGVWTKWYRNGKIQEEEVYGEANESGKGSMIFNFWDSLGSQLVKKGYGEYIEQEQEPFTFTRGPLVHGDKSGKWTGYLKNGEVAFIEEYDGGKLLSGVSYDSLGREYKYDKLSDGDMKPFYEFIGREMRYPIIARRKGIEGKVFILMVVSPDGSIIKSRVIKGIGSGCDEEALRVIDKYDGKLDWNIRRGQRWRVSKSQRMIIPLSFRLG